MGYFTKIDLARQSKLASGDTANYQGSINLNGNFTGGTGYFPGTLRANTPPVSPIDVVRLEDLPVVSGFTYTFNNGLTKDIINNVGLGGSLIENAEININNFELVLFGTGGTGFSFGPTFGNMNVDDGTNVSSMSVSPTFNQFSITNNSTSDNLSIGMTPTSGILIGDSILNIGMEYEDNYFANGSLSSRWIPDWGAVNSLVDGLTSGTTITLTTTGASGAATLGGGILNIPQYSGLTNPMTTLGDIIVGSTGGTPTRLGIGLANTVLSVNTAATGVEYRNLSISGGMGGFLSTGIISLFLQDQVINETPANIPFSNNGVFYILPTVTANTTFTISNASASGTKFLILNTNSGNTFSWQFSGATVTDSSGNILSKIENGGLYILESNGVNWVNLSQSISPKFFGIPTAPTASGGTNTSQIATTAFVTSAITSYNYITGYTFNNGLTLSGSNIVQLGGTLTKNTTVEAGNFQFNISKTGSTFSILTNYQVGTFTTTAKSLVNNDTSNLSVGLDSINFQCVNGLSANYSYITIQGGAQTGGDMSGTLGVVRNSSGLDKTIQLTDNVSLGHSGITVTDSIDNIGFLYANDYSATGSTNDRWIPDLGYVKKLIPSIVFGNLTGQTTSGLIVSATSVSTVSTYEVGGYINVTAIATDVIQGQVTYTDENSAPQTISLSNISAIGNNTISTQIIRVKPLTTIILKTNLTTGVGSIIFDAGGFIRKPY